MPCIPFIPSFLEHLGPIRLHRYFYMIACQNEKPVCLVLFFTFISSWYLLFLVHLRGNKRKIERTTIY